MRLILFITLLTISLSANASLKRRTHGITFHSGYSLLNGAIGAELQGGNFSLGLGYMPTRLEIDGKYKTSIGVSFSWYILPFERSLYISYGVASAGYTGGMYGTAAEPTAILMVGYRYWYDSFSVKAGAGVKYSGSIVFPTFEILIAYTL